MNGLFALNGVISFMRAKLLKMALPSEMNCLMKQEEGEGYTWTTMSLPKPEKDEVLIKVTKVRLHYFTKLGLPICLLCC